MFVYRLFMLVHVRCTSKLSLFGWISTQFGVKSSFSLLLWPQDLNLSKDLETAMGNTNPFLSTWPQFFSAAEHPKRIKWFCLQFLATLLKPECVKNVQTFKLWDMDSENSAHTHTHMWNGSNVLVFTTVQCTLWKVFSISPASCTKCACVYKWMYNKIELSSV